MTTDELVDDCLQFLQTRGVGPRLLVAFSGGLDSSVLVDVLVRAHRRGGPRPELIHVDHRMRPSSGDDARFCRHTADRHGLLLKVATLDLDDDAGHQRARTARMAAIAECALERGIDDVAFGHHGDDRIESFVLNLRRGTGLDGLAPMPAADSFPVDGLELRLVRPLIDRTRSQLEAYARDRSVDWVEDPTNRTDRYERNRIRHHLIPELADTSSTHERILEAVDRLGDERRAAEAHADLVESRAEKASPGLHSKTFDRTRLADAPRATVARIFQRLAPRLDADAIERIHDALRDHTAGPRHLTLSGCVVTVVRDRVVVEPSSARGGRDVLQRTARPVRLAPFCGGQAPFFGGSLRWELDPAADGESAHGPGDDWSADFDADELNRPLRVEGFVDGARLTRTDADGEIYHQKLTKLFSARRIDADCRWRWPCLYDDSDRLIWAAGLHRGAAAPVGAGTTDRWRLIVDPGDDLAAIFQH